MQRVRIVGRGRAGSAFAAGLSGAGWEVVEVLGRGADLRSAAEDVDLLILATPDAAVAEVASLVVPVPSTLVIHVAGSLGTDVLVPHARRGAVHPLVTLPHGHRGVANLTGGIWFAVAGDGQVEQVVTDLGGRSFSVRDDQRVLYHAAACIAANHVVALLGQVERLARDAGVPFEPYLGLTGGALADVEELGPAAALTGPAARGDETTIADHLAALPAGERDGYAAVADLARVLAAQR